MEEQKILDEQLTQGITKCSKQNLLRYTAKMIEGGTGKDTE